MVMKSYPRSSSPGRLVAALAVGSLLLTGCGGTSQAEVTATQKVDAKLREMLPASIRDKGTLTIGITTGFPPYTFYKPNTQNLTGYEPEMGKAIAERLGLKPVFSVGTFDSLIPSLQSSRVDIAMSGITDNTAREVIVDFVDYIQGSTGLIVKSEDKDKITSMESLCGVKVAVARGTNGQTVMNDVSAKCEKSGKPAVDMALFDDTSATLLAVQSGRAVAEPADTGKAVYQVDALKGKLSLINTQSNPSPMGLAVRKDAVDLRQAIEATVQQMYNDGSFTKDILKPWGLEASTLKDGPGVNLATKAK